MTGWARWIIVANSSVMKVCEREETDPKLITRNNKRGMEVSGEALLIGHKGSSYQTKAAAIRTNDEWRDHMEQKKEKDNTCMQNNDRWMNNKESKSMKH